jgi:hydroxymethylpyrimidine/phosphomethylpyrimidine kinase
MALPVVLSIAGYDPSSGAGVTADVKTAAAHGCFATTCITALTVQTTERVFAVEPVREEVVRDTLYELVRDMPPAAVRIGMLANGAVAGVVADFLETVRPPNVVLDPVLRSTSGAALLDFRGEKILRDRVLKVVDVVTPNVEEAAVLSGLKAPVNAQKAAQTRLEMASFALEIQRLGCPAVVVTGGHLEEAADLLVSGGAQEWMTAPKIESRATHGTGCAFAMAIACNLANGLNLREAVRSAKEYVRRAIETAEPLGQGQGPMNHLFRLQNK